MAYRPQFSPHPVIVNGNMAGNITSQPTVIQKLSMISYEASWSGATPIGAVSVQTSNSYSLNADGTVNNAGFWTTIPLAYNGTQVTSVPLTGNTGNGIIDIDALGSYALRFVYTATSGTGTLNVIISAKVS